MLTSSFLDVVFGADSSQAILGVDFPVRRRAATLVELAAKIGPGYSFLQARLPLAGLEEWRSAEAYVGHLAAAIQQYERPVRAVLGHSVGSVYAMAIADEISRWQDAPHVILLDPQSASLQLLCYELRAEINATSSLLSASEIQQAEEVAASISELASRGTARIADAADQMIDDYLDVVAAAFERVGLGDARDDGLIVAFASDMAWIAAADQVSPAITRERSAVIFSSDYARLPVGFPVGGSGRRILSDVGHADLLRSDSVAAAVLDMLRSC